MSDSEQMTEEILVIEENDSDEIRNLKRMVLTFKKRYQRAMQHSSGQGCDEEQKALIEQQNLLKEMLQKVQRESEEKIDKTRNDLLKAQEKMQILSETASTLTIENKALKDSQIEILSAREKEDVAVELTSEDAYQRISALQKENGNLREQHGQLKEFLTEAQEEFIQIKEELVKTRQRLATSERTIVELENQNDDLRSQNREAEEIHISERNTFHEQMEELKELLATTQEENNLFRMRTNKAHATLEKSQEELQQIKSTEENLERYKDHLTATLEDNKLLKSELVTFEEVAKLAQQEAIRKSNELDEALLKLQTAFEVSEELSKENIEQKKKIEESEELVEELEMIKGQFGKLKNEIISNREKIKVTHTALEESQNQAEELETENQKVNSVLTQKLNKVEELDKELFTMKQTLVQGLREAKEFKEHYQRAAGERTSMIQKNIQIQRQMQQQKENLSKKEAELQHVLSQVDDQRSFEDTLRGKEGEIETLTSKVQAFESELQQVKTLIEEKEEHIKQAQQHMAKKVKESSELNDMVVQQRSRITQLEDETQGAQLIKSEAKTSMESFAKQEKQLNEQIKIWEGKYFQIHDQWKELELQNKELKKLEEKYQQMQDFLSNFGSFAGNPEKQMRSPQSPKPMKKPQPKKEAVVNDMDLFSMKSPSSTPKDNFFE